MKLQIDLNALRFEEIKPTQTLEPGWYIRWAGRYNNFETLIKRDVVLMKVTESLSPDVVRYETYNHLDPSNKCFKLCTWSPTRLPDWRKIYKFARIEIIPQPALVKQVALTKINKVVETSCTNIVVVEGGETVTTKKTFVLENPLKVEDFAHEVFYEGSLRSFDQYVALESDNCIMLMRYFIITFLPKWQGNSCITFDSSKPTNPLEYVCFEIAKTYLYKLTISEEVVSG